MKCCYSCYNLVFFQRLFDVVGLSHPAAGDDEICEACVKFFTGANGCFHVTLVFIKIALVLRTSVLTTLLSVIVNACCRSC